jgi:tetratricopeptide (TPR) repeat protein
VLAGPAAPRADAGNKAEVHRELPAMLKQGRKLLLKGQPAAALERFQRYVEKHPEDSEGYFWVGTALLEQQKSDAAIGALRKAAELNSARGLDGAQVRVNLGNALLASNRVDDAIVEYKRAIKIDAYEPRAHFNLARALLKKETPYHAAVALTHLNIADKLGLSLPEIWKYRAQAYAMTRRYDEAGQQLSGYLAKLPDTSANAEARRKVNDLINILSNPPAEPDGLVPVKKRRYKLARDQGYAITHVDELRSLVTLVTTDQKDPDGGLQDGANDGFFQMRIEDFQKQLSEGAALQHPESAK